MVEDENGEGRVAARRSTVLGLAFLLKVDMIEDNARRSARSPTDRRRRQQLPSHLIP
jgi:hypothetical protein